MKRSVFLIALVILGFWSATAWAQKPKLNTMTFRVEGKTVNCVTGEVKVGITLDFNTTKRDTIPKIFFGLTSPYSEPVPLYDEQWVNNKTTFVAYFDINNTVPKSADGLYKFLIRKAYAAAGDTMAPALSDTIKNSSGQTATLYISRLGKLTVSTNKIDFDTTQAGVPKDKTLKLKNVTCAEITLMQPGVSAPFLIPTSPNGAKVAPDSSYSLVVRFDPFNRTAYARTLKLYYNSNQQTDSVTVQLAGVSHGPELVFLPPPVLKFDSVYVDSTTSKTIRLTNRKASNASLSDTLKITSIAMLRSDTSFSIVPTTLTMAPGDTKTVTVNFKPAAGGSYTNTLEFTGNDFVNKPRGKVSFPVSGTGKQKTPPPQITNLIITWPGGRSGYTNSDFLSICLDVDISQVKDVRWKFWESAVPPASPNDTTGTARFTTGKCFTIPLRGVLTSGRWNCYVWLEGRNGVSGYRAPNVSVLNYDTVAPTFNEQPYVSVGWTGGFAGYTNADNITMCWEAADASGIYEVRWKFTATPNAKPSGDNDLGDGGGFIRQGGISCANLLLRGKLPREGRWYCYLWLVDSLGNSSHANAFRSEFTYDRTPPAKPKPPFELYANGRRIFEANWFNRGPLSLMFNLPSGATDAAKVYWKFRSLAKDSLQLNPDANNRVSFSIPFDSRVACGYDSLNFWFADLAGNANADSFAVVRYRFDVCAPLIARTREAVANKQKEFIDNLRITDHSFADSNSVAIFYRFGGSQDDGLFLSRDRRKIAKFKGTSGETLRVQLNFPAEALTSRGLEYRVAASDSLNPPGLSLWVPVRVRIPTDGEFRTDEDGKAVPFAHGADSSAYRLIAMPFWLNKKTPNEVLGDDLGPYDPTKWRLFDYQGESKGFVEWTKPNFRLFEPGRAFFLIVRDSNKVIDSGSASTVSTGKDTTLTLQEGWNLVGNPFNFPISLESLEIHNSILQGQIFARERTWDPHIDTFEPWRGYAIKVVHEIEGPITLRIPPIAAPSRRSKTLARAVEAAGEWTIQIAAKAGAELDTINWAGARKMAAEEYDDFDLVEPPVIGNYVSASFPNMSWSRLAMEYTADFRPLGRDLYEWPLKVASNYSGGEVVLQFKGMANLPAGFEAYLVDEAYGVARNLRRNPEYRFAAGANGVEKSLKLLVGKPETLQKHNKGIALVPKAFELSQNFPNPFAAKYQQSFTAIRYALPKSANVTVEVYNMLGQKVRTLVAGQAQAADYYLATWDGRDEAGKEVSSGVYVYRLLAESDGERFTATKKLLLVK